MTDAFLSHVDEDREIAELIAAELEARGCRVWFYERDSIPGLSYLLQTREAIDRARSFLFLISPAAINRHTQLEKELVHAHEIDKPIIPILCDVQFRDFRQLRPSWHQAIGANVGIEVTMQNVRASIPRLFSGLVAIGIGKLNETKSQVESTESGVSVDADLDVSLSEDNEIAEEIGLTTAEADEAGEEIANESVLATFAHEHPTTGFLADAIFSQPDVEIDGTLSIAFSHALLKPDPFIVNFRPEANRDPVQYFRFPDLIHGYPVILRAYWLNRLPEASMFQRTFGAVFAPPIRVQQTQSILMNEDEVGIIVQGEFRSIIPAGESLPRIQKRRFRTARTNQKAISITPAVRRSNGQTQYFSAMRLTVPLAAKGVAWLEFTFRIDPDGRLTLIARDPLHRMKIRDIFVVQ